MWKESRPTDNSEKGSAASPVARINFGARKCNSSSSPVQWAGARDGVAQSHCGSSTAETGDGRSEAKLPLASRCGTDGPVFLSHQNATADLTEQSSSLGISEAIYNIPFSQGLGA